MRKIIGEKEKKEYEILMDYQLGSGKFGKVYLVNHLPYNKMIAVKMISAQKLIQNETLYDLFMREVDVMKQIKGEYIVQLIEVLKTKNNLYIFMDYCEDGTLEAEMEARINAEKIFTEEEVCRIIKQIATSFVTIENSDIVNDKKEKVTIIHRDIKPANILLHKGSIKVADFGFAKMVETIKKDEKSDHTFLGTPVYMAPQILNQKSYSAKCDVWSTGIMAFELLFRAIPWDGKCIPTLYKNIKTKPLKFPNTNSISCELKDLLTKMLTFKDEDRISWNDVLNHPALENIKLTSDDIKETSDAKKKEEVKENLYGNEFKGNLAKDD